MPANRLIRETCLPSKCVSAASRGAGILARLAVDLRSRPFSTASVDCHSAALKAARNNGADGWLSTNRLVLAESPAVSLYTSLLPDSFSFSGTVNESITQVGGLTTSAYLRITNILVQDTTGLPINDNIYLFSDAFSPSAVGTGGVGIIGYYGNTVLPRGGPVAASLQAQMQFELIAVQPGTFTLGSSLTTPPSFVNCAACSPVGFHEFARGPILLGTTQLVGVLNFHLSGLGSAVYLPGSVILDDNDPALARSEVPEEDPVRLVISGVAGMVLLMFRRRWA